MEAATATALALLEAFVGLGAARWRETPKDRRQAAAFLDLPRVAAKLQAGTAAGHGPDAAPRAITAAIEEAVEALPHPDRAAARALLGFTPDAMAGKTYREKAAAEWFGKGARWMRTPNGQYDGATPGTWLLTRVAEQVAAPAPEVVDDAAGASLDPSFAKVSPSFRYERVCQQMAAAREQIRILVTWVPDVGQLLPGIAEAVRHGASVEILLQHPRADGLAARLAELGIDPDHGETHARKLFGDLRPVMSGGGAEHIAVRTFQASPMAQLYATEESLWFGVFWPDRYSLAGPQVEVSTRGSYLGRSSSEYFESMWSSASPFTARDLQR